MSLLPRLCATCGTQYPLDFDLDLCKICAEERQYIPEEGQIWTTHQSLQKTHTTSIRQI